MPVVYVARHGETDWNRAGRYQGQQESSLTELGVRQANALARALAGSRAARVVCSPLSRCVETGRPVARALGVELETDPLLLEIAHGTWEGRLREDIERDDAERAAAWRDQPQRVAFEGGETLEDVAGRWSRFAGRLAGKKGDVVVVTHDVVVRLAILAARGEPLSSLWKPRVENGGYAVFEAASPQWKLLDERREEHLGDDRADPTRQAL